MSTDGTNPPGGGWGQPPGGGGFGAPPSSGHGTFGGGPPVQSAFGGPAGAPMTPQPAGAPPPKKKNPWLWAIVLGPIALCCLGGMGLAALGAFENQKYGDLDTVCEGRSVSGAPAYTPGAANRAVGYKVGATGSWIRDFQFVQGSSRADGLESANVVVCVDEETEEQVDHCPYEISGATNVLDLHRYKRHVRLVAARAGQLIVEQDLYGTAPSPCQEWELFQQGGTTVNRYGGHVADDDVAAFVADQL